MTSRAELSLAADGLPMELPLLQVRTSPRCVGAAAEERPHVGLCQCLGTNRSLLSSVGSFILLQNCWLQVTGLRGLFQAM